jgi:DNA-binding MarR family transcriptional regulator
MNQKSLPIGYWLKRTDSLLTEGINAIQAEFGINRVQWQIIHTIAENPPLEFKALAEVMKPFADENQLVGYLDTLKEMGTLTGHETLYLTEKGQRLHTECLHKQKEFREKAMLGVSNEEYEVTLSTLEKIVKNLS